MTSKGRVRAGLDGRAIELGAVSRFLDIYHEAAGRLARDVGQGGFTFSVEKDGALIEGSPGLLWRPFDRENPASGVPLDMQGFGTFGPVGRRFGSPRVVEGGESYWVEPEEYVRIAARFVSTAVVDTVRALLHFERLVDELYKNRPFVEETHPYLESL